MCVPSTSDGYTCRALGFKVFGVCGFTEARTVLGVRIY